jgi:hypothetical protein
MIISTQANTTIDKFDNMYPCMLHKITNSVFTVPPNSTIYGFVLEGEAKLSTTKSIEQFEFFSINSLYKNITVECNGCMVIIVKYGFHGQNVFGGPVESKGRLCYINNCSDSLLVYPPRMGDPSMNLLYFPDQVAQDFHVHPSLRLGIVFRGEGYAETKKSKHDLLPGTVFCIEDQELHRFVTQESSMSIISFHPDGSWGPMDDNHVLINRTYLK